MISRGELLAKWAREGREELGKVLIRRKSEFLNQMESVKEEEELVGEFLAWYLVRQRKGARGAIIAPWPRTLKRLQDLVTEALRRDQEYGGRRMRVEEAHKAHVEQLVSMLLAGGEAYARYRLLVYQPTRESLKQVEEVEQLRTRVQTYVKAYLRRDEVWKWFGKVWRLIEGWING